MMLPGLTPAHFHRTTSLRRQMLLSSQLRRFAGPSLDQQQNNHHSAARTLPQVPKNVPQRHEELPRQFVSQPRGTLAV